MPKSLLVYFSVGGTTARVAESIAAGLGTAVHRVDLCNLKDGPPPEPDGYDLLAVGSPAHYYRPPFLVQDYLDGLPHLHGLPVAAFVLHGTYRGDTGNIIRRALTRRGGREAGYFRCYGADYFLGYLNEGVLFSPDHPTPTELDRAQEFGRRVAEVVAGAEYDPPAADPSPAWIYRFERFLLNRWLARNVYYRFFRVRAADCTACGLCIERCPAGNLTADAEGRPVWGPDCQLCLDCQMRCPQDAIDSPVSWPIMRLLLAINVRRAAGDPSLDRVRVTHRRGRTRRRAGG